MASLRFTVDSPRPPEEVFGALIDFSERRPALWPTIDPSVYTLHAAGEGWAEATEGTDVMGGIWARERYDWSPGRVRATIVDSNMWLPGGTWEATITSRTGGGSRVTVVRDRHPRNVKARMFEVVMRIIGARVLAAELSKAPAVSGAPVTRPAGLVDRREA